MFNTEPMQYAGHDGELAVFREPPMRKGERLPHTATDEPACANPIRGRK